MRHSFSLAAAGIIAIGVVLTLVCYVFGIGGPRTLHSLLLFCGAGMIVCAVPVAQGMQLIRLRLRTSNRAVSGPTPASFAMSGLILLAFGAFILLEV